MRNYVTNYLEWEQTLVMLFYGFYYQGPPMEAVHMIKFGSKKPFVYKNATFPEIPWQDTPPFTHPVITHPYPVFAATIQKRIVIGVDYRYRSPRKSLEVFKCD